MMKLLQARRAFDKWRFGRGMQRVKRFVVGQHLNDGWAAKLLTYFLLIILAYLYIQPMIYMGSTMFKPLEDLLDPTVGWIPRTLTWDNLQRAWEGLKYPEAVTNTLFLAIVCSMIQTFVCAMIGYGLARMEFPGKTLITALVMLTFLIPPQITIIPTYVIFSRLGWLDTPLVFLIPAIFGQGVKSALFILIYRQFFKAQPASLEEAAKLDGASLFRLFFRIMLPLARSAALVVFLFSFIWYWNLYYEPSMLLSNNFVPLSISLDRLDAVLNGTKPGYELLLMDVDPVTEGTKMGAAALIILPPILLYMFLQRWFVEGLERTGMVD